MRVLALDCSSAVGSVAVLEAGELIFAREFAAPRGRGGPFFSVLKSAVDTAGKPERVAVGLGPGSYNGLRVAAAAAEGLGIATGAVLVGIASVRALPCAAEDYVAISDARGGVFYFIRVRERALVGEIELLSQVALSERLEGLGRIDVIAPSALPEFPGVISGTPDAAIIARLAAEENPGTGPLEPIYLKPPHVTAPRERV